MHKLEPQTSPPLPTQVRCLCLGPGMHASNTPPFLLPRLPVQAPPTCSTLPCGGGLSNPGFVHSLQGGRGGSWAEAKWVLEAGRGSLGGESWVLIFEL